PLRPRPCYGAQSGPHAVLLLPAGRPVAPGVLEMPPSAEAVLRAGPLVLAGLAVPAAAVAAAALTERPSSGELLEQKEESCRRAKHVTEMVDILVKTQDAALEGAEGASPAEQAGGQTPGPRPPREDSDGEGSGQSHSKTSF
ncbi:unnamed protein product, partial [Prorocentrum cordatum]